MKIIIKLPAVIIFLILISCEELPDGPVEMERHLKAGSQFAYVSSYNGRNSGSNYDIFTLSKKGLIVNMTNSKENENHEFKVSPDQSRILYDRTSSSKTELCLMDIDGSNFELLATNSTHPFNATFSADGQKITYTGDNEGDAEVYIMDLKSRKIKNVSNFHEIEGVKCYDGFSVFSPDGSTIAYTSGRFPEYWNNTHNRQIILSDTSGNNIINLSQNSADAFGPKFSYDGKYLVYSCKIYNGLDNPASIYSVELKSQTNIQLTDGQRLATTNVADYFKTSPTEDVITYSAQRDDRIFEAHEIYLAPLDGSERIMVSDFTPEVVTEHHQIYAANFNSKGTKIVFTRNFGRGIYTIDIATKKVKNHTEYFTPSSIKYLCFVK